MTDDDIPTPHMAKVIYDDADIVVVCKPSGMPSVPGLDGRESLQELLQKMGQDLSVEEKLKELVGHTLPQVLVGAILGTLIGVGVTML